MPNSRKKFLLDDISAQAGAAYSSRRLSSNYEGPLLAVRRASDNAQRNIYYDSDGSLDVNDLMSFAGSANAVYIVIWYDQSGNSRDVTNPTAANQPVVINASGSLRAINGRTAPLFTTVPAISIMGLYNSSPFMYLQSQTAGSSTLGVSAVFTPTLASSPSVYNVIVGEANFTGVYPFFANMLSVSGSAFVYPYALYRNTNSTPLFMNNLGGSVAYSTPTIFSAQSVFVGSATNASTITGYLNGSTNSGALTFTNAGTTPYTMTNFGVGCLPRSSNQNYDMNGYLGETIVFTSAVSIPDFYTIQISQSQYWGIGVTNV